MQEGQETYGSVVATGKRCPECEGPMVRLSGPGRLSWACTSSRCGETFTDRERRPDQERARVVRKPARRRHD